MWWNSYFTRAPVAKGFHKIKHHSASQTAFQETQIYALISKIAPTQIINSPPPSPLHPPKLQTLNLLHKLALILNPSNPLPHTIPRHNLAINTRLRSKRNRTAAYFWPLVLLSAPFLPLPISFSGGKKNKTYENTRPIITISTTATLACPQSFSRQHPFPPFWGRG